eukprot:4704288-Lingulodinium_polyedra.AAC.1
MALLCHSCWHPPTRPTSPGTGLGEVATWHRPASIRCPPRLPSTWPRHGGCPRPGSPPPWPPRASPGR